MDSLTQIVLGAACGEAVAGKKIGNRAMLWGAVGGTIPDLDVFASLFTDEITSTSFHRGFMHSFLFAVLAPWVLAWLAGSRPCWRPARPLVHRPALGRQSRPADPVGLRQGSDRGPAGERRGLHRR